MMAQEKKKSPIWTNYFGTSKRLKNAFDKRGFWSILGKSNFGQLSSDIDLDRILAETHFEPHSTKINLDQLLIMILIEFKIIF